MAFSVKTGADFASGSAEVGYPSTRVRPEQVKGESFQTLAGDLFAIREQIQEIIGESSPWSDVSASKVTLAELHEHIDASGAVQIEILKDMLAKGAVKIEGDAAATEGSLYLVGSSKEIAETSSVIFADGELAVTGDISATANLSAVDATLSGDLSAVDATLSGNLAAVDATLSGDLAAVDATLSGDLAAVNATLSGDLAAVNGTFSADLAAVNATLSGDLVAVNGDFSGNIEAVDADFSGNLVVAGNLTVEGTTTYVDSTTVQVGDINLDLGAQQGTTMGNDAAVSGGGITLKSTEGDKSIIWTSADGWSLSEKIKVNGDAVITANLSAVDATLSGDLAAVDGTFSGDLAAVDATLSGDLAAVAGTFSGNVSMIDLTAEDGAFSGVLGVTGKADFAGIVDVAGTLSASAIKIDLDEPGRLYIVGAEGQIEDEAKLTFNGTELWVNGAFEAVGAAALGSTLDVAGNTVLAGQLDVASASFFAENMTLDKAAAQSILKTGGHLSISGSNDLRLAAGQAMKFVDVFRESSTWSSATGVQLASAASSWSAYKLAFGGTELSLLDAIATVATGAGGGKGKWAKTYSGAAGTAVVFVGADQVGPGTAAPSFPADAGRVDVYLNGQLMADGDISSLSAATVTFTFNVQPNDVVVAVIR